MICCSKSKGKVCSGQWRIEWSNTWCCFLFGGTIATTGNTAYPRPDAEGLERLRALAEQASKRGVIIGDEGGPQVFLMRRGPSYLLPDVAAEDAVRKLIEEDEQRGSLAIRVQVVLGLLILCTAVGAEHRSELTAALPGASGTVLLSIGYLVTFAVCMGEAYRWARYTWRRRALRVQLQPFEEVAI